MHGAITHEPLRILRLFSAVANITFEHLVGKGITPQIMAAFTLPLSDWTDLGFAVKHAEAMSADDCQLVFGLQKTEFVQMLRTFVRAPCAQQSIG